MPQRPLWPLLLAALIACTRPHDARREVVHAGRASTRRAEPRADVHARVASAQELALVQQLMRETEQLRGLAFRAPVRVSIEDRVAMRAYVEQAIDDDQLERARRRYLALGVLDPTLDVRALLIEMMEEELIGYYDPEQKRLAVRNDIAQALERGEERSGRSLMWRATVVHELVHALQDQHFALGDKIDEQRTTDADNAFGALVEGDATLAMLGYTARLAGESLESLSAHPERVQQLMTRAPDQLTGALRRAPALVREPLLFRYREGAAFCAELFRNGGWAAIDTAHRTAPQSSQAIRQPQRYVAREPEPSLALPDLAWLAAEGVRNIDEDVLGSLELSVVLGASELDALAIVSAWRGDRYVVLERAGTLSSLWWLRFASSHAARSAVAAFERLGDVERRIARHGELVVVARGVTKELFERAAAQSRDRGSRAAEAAPDRRSRALDKRLHPLATASHGH
jgi:hypothetical protein